MDEREIRASDAREDSTPFEAAGEEAKPADFSLPSWLDEAIARSQHSEPPSGAPRESGAPEPWDLGPEIPAFLDPPDHDALSEDLALEAPAFPDQPAPAASSEDLALELANGSLFEVHEATVQHGGKAAPEASELHDDSRPLLGDNAALPSFLPHHRRELPPSLQVAEYAPARPVSPRAWLAAALIFAGSAAALFVAMQLGKKTDPETTATAAPAGAEAPRSVEVPLASAPQEAGPSVDQSAGVDQSPAVDPPPAVDQSAASDRTAAASMQFGISVGTFRSEERAIVERARLVATTGLASRTVILNEGGETLYRVVFGSFDSHESADSTAVALVQRGLIPEALVVPLGGADSRPR